MRSGLVMRAKRLSWMPQLSASLTTYGIADFGVFGTRWAARWRSAPADERSEGVFSLGGRALMSPNSTSSGANWATRM